MAASSSNRYRSKETYTIQVWDGEDPVPEGTVRMPSGVAGDCCICDKPLSGHLYFMLQAICQGSVLVTDSDGRMDTWGAEYFAQNYELIEEDPDERGIWVRDGVSYHVYRWEGNAEPLEELEPIVAGTLKEWGLHGACESCSYDGAKHRALHGVLLCVGDNVAVSIEGGCAEVVTSPEFSRDFVLRG